MQRRTCFTIAALSFVSWIPAANCQPILGPNDAVMNRQPVLPAQAMAVDDYFTALAKAARVNVFADVTRVPGQDMVQPYPGTEMSQAGLQGAERGKWTANLFNLVGDLQEQAQLTLVRNDEKTLLFWREPEIVALATRIAANRRLIRKELQAPLLSDEQLYATWRGYFQQAFGFDGRARQANFTVALRDLPLAARSLVLKDLQLNLVGYRDNWYRDDIWPKARLSILKGGYQVGNGPILKQYILETGIYLLPDSTQTDEKVLSREEYVAYRPPADAARVQAVALQGENQPETHGMYVTVGYLSGENPQGKEFPAAGALQNGVIAATAGPSNKAEAGLKPREANVAYLSDLDMAKDAALQRTISVEARRKSLPQLLVECSEKSGLSLRVAPEGPAESLLVTAHADGITLAQALSILSRMYGLRWARSDGSLTAHLPDQEELDVQLLQVGDPIYYRYRRRMESSSEKNFMREQAIADAVASQVNDWQRLDSKDGVPLNSLPAATQTQVRQVVQERMAELVVLEEFVGRALTSGELYLHLGEEPASLNTTWSPQEGESQIPGSASVYKKVLNWNNQAGLFLTVRRADGSLVAPVFRNIDFQSRAVSETTIRQMLRNGPPGNRTPQR